MKRLFRQRLPGGGYYKPPLTEGIACDFLQEFESLIDGLATKHVLQAPTVQL